MVILLGFGPDDGGSTPPGAILRQLNRRADGDSPVNTSPVGEASRESHGFSRGRRSIGVILWGQICGRELIRRGN